MEEIRLCWIALRTAIVDGDIVERGLWRPDNEESRNELQVLLDAGNEVWGAGSHWIETREVTEPVPKETMARGNASSKSVQVSV